MRSVYFLFLFAIATNAQAQIITTFAGNGSAGSSGNGGPAISAQLFDAQTVCIDNSGNIYIADHGNHVIRKVNTSGIISIFAGNGALGYLGDGGPATSAQLGYPYGVCADAAGNIYITDDYSHTIRKVDINGIISTVAGNGNFGYSGDGGLAINAELYAPCSICTDNIGNIYFVEFGTDIIRKINNSGIISTVAGTPWINGNYGDGGLAIEAQLSSPTGVSVDNAGNIYIADVGNCVIRKVDPSGIITTFAGGAGIDYAGDGGPATLAQLRFPYFVHADNNGNVFISDTGNGVLRMVNSAGVIVTIAGNGILGYSGDGGPATSAQLAAPGGMCIDNSGNIYIADGGAHVVRKIGACPIILISLQPKDQSLCSSGDVSFTIDVTDVTSYQWQVNTGTGWNDVINDDTYTGSAARQLNVKVVDPSMNNYQYRCVLKNACANLFSATAQLFVTTPKPPAITISTSTDTICAGSTTTFVALPANEGATPLYQWKKNGGKIATGSSYVSNNINDGDVITCVLTSNYTCITTNTAESNAITMKVNPQLTPSVIISASANNICGGTPVTFSSATTNAGDAPLFQWQKNGINTGTDLGNYVDSSLKDADVITCVLTAGYKCANVSSISSNIIVMDVTSVMAPSVTISTPRTTICPKRTISFLATPENGGTATGYQWKKNDLRVGTNANTYTDSNIINGDVVKCSVTFNDRCLIDLLVTSNDIAITVLKNPVIDLDKTNTLCAGKSRLLDAGNNSSFLWNDGSTGRNLLVNKTGMYSVIVTDNNGCSGTDTTLINSIVPGPAGFLPGDTSVCSYGSVSLVAKQGYLNYLWSNNSTSSAISIEKPGLYWLQVTDFNNCTGKESINVLLKDCMQGFFAPNAFTPNNDGKNDIFKPLLFGIVRSYAFTIYNRFGQTVFKNNNVTLGWDGTFKGLKLDSDVYVWVCSYQIEGQNTEVKKGTVFLIR